MTRDSQSGNGGNGGPGNDDREPPATREEQARATALGERIDELLGGVTRPPAMPADERALLEVATSVRAIAGATTEDLSPLRIRSIVDAAIASADDRWRARTTSPPAPETDADASAEAAAPGEPDDSDDQRDELSTRRLAGKAAPWLIALASTAAALTLALRSPSPSPAPAMPPGPPRLAEAMLSRPADDLVGRIERAEAGLASERIDAIFTDRMRGFRALRLAKAGRATAEEELP